MMRTEAKETTRVDGGGEEEEEEEEEEKEEIAFPTYRRKQGHARRRNLMVVGEE